jgi:hypothetical protein
MQVAAAAARHGKLKADTDVVPGREGRQQQNSQARGLTRYVLFVGVYVVAACSAYRDRLLAALAVGIHPFISSAPSWLFRWVYQS